MLSFDIQFAVEQYRYKPPPRLDKDPNERERYYRRLGDAVRDQLKLSWTFERKAKRQG
jgi:hypothetical protein